MTPRALSMEGDDKTDGTDSTSLCSLDSRSEPSCSVPSPYTDRSFSEDSYSQQCVHKTRIDWSDEAETFSYMLSVASRWPGKGRFVPQKLYRAPTDQSRRMGHLELQEPIIFFQTNPDQCGISCRDALLMKVSRLARRDDPAFRDCGSTISLRLMWPGYPPCARQIPARDFRRPSGPITYARLAKSAAKTVERYLKDLSPRLMHPGSDLRWRIGRGGITFDDLEIIGLQQVSMGSWQVHLRLIS